MASGGLGSVHLPVLFCFVSGSVLDVTCVFLTQHSSVAFGSIARDKEIKN